jgi:branched-chain amino acid transport system ATP-binding protein
MTPMLSFENINVAIAGAPVLRNVSFALQPGASAALIGRNGAGKTTTVRTIMGFTEASGTVRLGGEDLGPIPPHRRPSLGLGYAPEDRRLFSAFTVEENILLPGRVAKLSGRDAAAAGAGLFGAAGTEGTRQASRGIGLGRPGQDGRARPRADARHTAAHSGRAVPGPRARAGAALRGSAPPASSQDKDITLLITESNPKLLETFADVTLTIERGEISSQQGQ